MIKLTIIKTESGKFRVSGFTKFPQFQSELGRAPFNAIHYKSAVQVAEARKKAWEDAGYKVDFIDETQINERG